MSKQVILEFPVDLPEDSLRDPEILKEGKTVIVLMMLQKGFITQNKAAELMEIDLERLFSLIEMYNIFGEGLQTLQDPTTATAGAWKDLIDCQTFEREIYESRVQHIRSEVQL